MHEAIRAYLAAHPKGDTLIAYFQNFTNSIITQHVQQMFNKYN